MSRHRRNRMARGRSRGPVLNEGKVMDSLKKSMASAAQKLVSKIDEKIGQLKSYVPVAEELTDMVLDVEGGTQVISDIQQDGSKFKDAADDIKSIDLPAIESVKTESAVLRSTHAINETVIEMDMSNQSRRLLKEVGVFEIVGLGLALMGGIPMVLKLLMKLAGFFKLNKTKEVLKKAYDAAHHFEETVVDYLVPDRISYAVYKKFTQKFGKGKKILEYEAYRGSKERKRFDKMLYLVLLTPWLINGLIALKHFVSNMINWVEAGATAVKGIEVAELGVELPQVIRDIAVAAAESEEVIDVINTGVEALTSGD